MAFRHVWKYLALCCLLSVFLAVPADAVFSDVPEEHWASGEIQRCVELGLLRGESEERFGVGSELSRGEFVQSLCRLFGWKDKAPAEATYADVPPDSWCYEAVENACAHGAIISQTEVFRPNDSITREEVAVMLVRSLGYELIAGRAQELPMRFQDVASNAGYITVACDMGFLQGMSSTEFAPGRPATRGQAAVILVRLYEKLFTKAARQIAVATAEESLPDLAGYEAVAVAASKLIYANRMVQFNALMAEGEASAVRAAAQDAGAKALLYVSGSENVLLQGEPEATAELLASAAEEDAYDGLFLNFLNLRTLPAQQKLNALASALRERTDMLLYIVVEAPAWDDEKVTLGYDVTYLGNVADRLVVRVRPYRSMAAGGFPTAPMEPLEEVYYALSMFNGSVEPEKLSLFLTTDGSLWSAGFFKGSVAAKELASLQKKEGTKVYYSDRYACAYLDCMVSRNRTVVWYLNGAAVAERVKLASAFGVYEFCLSDLNALSPAFFE